jgi:hypothetical protein
VEQGHVVAVTGQLERLELSVGRKESPLLMRNQYHGFVCCAERLLAKLVQAEMADGCEVMS